MRNWFLLTAMTIIAMISSFYLISSIIFFYTLKVSIRRFLFKLNVSQKQQRKNKLSSSKKYLEEEKKSDDDLAEIASKDTLFDDTDSTEEDNGKDKERQKGITERVILFLIKAVVY